MSDWREEFWKMLSPETAARLRAQLKQSGDWDKGDEAAAERAARPGPPYDLAYEQNKRRRY